MEGIKVKCDEITRKIKASGENTIVDGIINIDKYLKEPIKILWIVKEPNSEKGNWNYQGYLSVKNIEAKRGTKEDTLKYRFFVKLLNVSYCILKDISSTTQLPKITEKDVYGIGESLAYINIKKTGGGSSSNDKVIYDAYSKNKELLLNQIKTYNPNIIIFGNTLRYFSKNDLKEIGWDLSNTHVEKSKHSSGYFVAKDKLCIKAYHPSYWVISNDDYCSDFISLVQKWKNNVK